MKNHIIVLVLLLLGVALFATPGTITLQNSPMAAELLRNNVDGLKVRYAIDEISHKQITSKEGVWTELSILNYTTTNRVGVPSIPLMRQLISVPLGAHVSATIQTSSVKTLNLTNNGIVYPLIPRQAEVSKSADLNNLPFVVDREFYNANNWTTESPISVTELGMIRGTRIFALDFVPIRYNPSLKQMEVIYNAEVQVSFEGADNAATEELKAKTYSPAFEGAIADKIINYEPARATLNRYPLGYVIILPSNFVAPMQPFIDWKRREGYNVTVATTDVTGTTANSIKTYMQNMWNAATTENPAPSYLLIVGDVAQVPSNTGATGSHPTDLNYVRLQGTDYMPELYFGRFSATTVAEVTNQVNKTLMHEQYTMPSDAYLGEAVMIAGVDSNYGSSHANGQINYGTTNYFNAAHGINSHTYLYPASGNSDAAIVSDVSAGAGYVNYTAHGDVTYWADPNFTITNINSLQNTNKSAFVVGNCCLTSKFDSAICFAEAWLRATNKGAVIYIGGTNSTYWDPDYYWGVGYKPPVVGSGSPFVANRTGVYDGIFHEHNEAFADWVNNAGSMVLMGNLAVVASNSTYINYYWEIYSIMGDPSLVPYVGIPAQNSFQAPPQLFLGLGTIDIQADPYTQVSISMNNQLHGVGLTNASGALTLNYTPFTQPGTAQIVLTRSRRRPMIANVQVIANVGPYITTGIIGITDGNNNIPEAGETLSVSVPLNNVGVANATNITCTLAVSGDWVQIANPVIAVPDIAAGGNVNLTDAFSLTIDPNIPDQTELLLTFLVNSGTQEWATERLITVNAPNMVFAQPIIFDTSGDGIYQSGENLNITLDISNTGHMVSGGGNLRLFVSNENAIVDVTSFMIPALPIDYILPLNFDVTLAEGLPDGTIVRIGIAFDSGIQMFNSQLAIPVGLVGEGFESGSFTEYPWVNTSSSPWTAAFGSATSHSGSYSAKSGQINHYGSTVLQVSQTAATDGSIKFWRKTSSEGNHDYLTFYIDGTVIAAWSGALEWAEMAYPVTAGTHTYKWTYSKDGSTSNGSDCVWIDDIVFPGAGTPASSMIYTTTAQINFLEVQPHSTVSADFILRNMGNANLQGTISVPAGFVLNFNGTALPNNYNYQIPGGITRVYSISYTSGASVPNINDDIIITSNDPDMPTLLIPLHLEGVTSNDDAGLIPFVTSLEKNFPNPFNPETTIRFTTKEAGQVKLSVYNLKGQLIRNLVNNSLASGAHNIVWNGKDENGNSVASGIYLYRMETTNYSATQKMMLMK
ncbi:MAG: Gingipain R [Candidatus Cloacimonetes bacterium HGW-Cloacimonetes-3]|jgi:hypothetical protein|nr:MAG: Gingipain R [Candidatus Cloacimonetes bacterium HGW-Cloacimonetes-3]